VRLGASFFTLRIAGIFIDLATVAAAAFAFFEVTSQVVLQFCGSLVFRSSRSLFQPVMRIVLPCGLF